ncbi:MAG: GatB/YqeY domain-containing protein [Parcubacteria group bacterium]|nr:GatB/YqeY domain-containing protein [Parcubacteria group bacterium]
MLQKQIRAEMTDAMKAREEVKLRVLRGLVAAFTNELVAKKRKPDEELTDEEVLVVIKRAVKQRQDSIEQFKKGGREDLVETEEEELQVLQLYMPETMGVDEIRKVAEAKKAELKIDDKAKMGMLMGAVMSELKNNADGNLVKKVVESMFG